MNTTAPLMTDIAQSDIVRKQRAELYMRIYQYAAEDFVHNLDFWRYTSEIKLYMESVELELDYLMKLISKHVHAIPPHFHISAKPGDPTSPMPLTTLVTPQSAAIQWTTLTKPHFINTTNISPNTLASHVEIGTGMEGDITPELRRALPLPILLKPTIPPIMTGLL